MASAAPLLRVDKLSKIYSSYSFQSVFKRSPTFRLDADFEIAEPRIVGVMGPNGSGKTTLFELITGSNQPSTGKVYCAGRDIHNVRYKERDRLAIHYHQSYQVRHFRRTKPAFLMQRANNDYPLLHLFDEPQFNTQDGYIGFMLDFFRRLRRENRLVFLCLHPNEAFHLEILQELCEQFIFVQQGQLQHAADYNTLIGMPEVRSYLGELLY